jgi:hypothetical protein
MKRAIKQALEQWNLPSQAKAVRRRDHAGSPGEDPGPERVIELVAQWLCDAQDCSPTQDGGCARSYSLRDGWVSSYPETTGYIIPTFLQLSETLGRRDLKERAQRMLDWFVDIQLPGGGFQGGKIDSQPVVPVTFNTGQILLGLAAGVRAFDDYRDTFHGAARFLRDSLDDDGCWRSHPTPFAKPGEKAYETHVAWGLFEADRVAPGEGYGEAGLRQVRWALTKQEQNGWVRDCCLDQPAAPLTHTLGYYLRGLLEAYKWSSEPDILDACLRTADGLCGTQRINGALPGRLKNNWTPAVDWVCLTGNVQVAACWLELAELADRDDLRTAALAANRFVRQTVRSDAPVGIRGGVKGAHPVDGDYGRYEYLNWAAKFTIDANLMQLHTSTA